MNKREDDVCREDDEIAVREVDEPHDPEDEGEAHGKQGIEATEQHALDDGIEHAGHRLIPK